ncbi:serine hydrolase domain-containing protein [Pseudomonas aeruginosa]|uniref:serine hydrolase domain-containing protein n=1 Tax=Pseudomonas aeruginosa TaxID=287 RepID=UPI002236BF38|nr:serine hydrolase domain-containing protein [Pseudomonas aeruginosa]
MPSPIRRRSSPAPTSRNGDACSSRPPMAMATRALAGFYSGLLRGRLLEDELLGQLAHEHAVGEDRTLLTRTRFGLGTMLDQPGVANATCGLGPKAFGHPGAGGSIGFADPERDLAFSFVSNALGPYVLMDPRAQQLARVAGECL